MQAERQELWDKLETPSVRQWFLDPKRAPGQPFQEATENKDHDPVRQHSSYLIALKPFACCQMSVGV